MRKLIWPPFLVVLATFCLSATAHAQLVFTTGGVTDYSLGGEYADTGDPGHGEYYNMAGDIFSPSISGLVNSISFSGTYYGESPQNDNFTLSLYSVSSGMPADLITSTVIDTTRSADAFNSSYYNYAGTLETPIELTAGMTYYLGISNTTGPDWGNWLAGVNADPNYLTEYSYDATDGKWVSDPSAQVLFTLSTPEPSTWMLLAISFGVFAFWRMRTRAATVTK